MVVTPRYLMFSTFSRTVPARVYETWIYFYPFPCYLHHIAFHRLKSHTPFPCPAFQLICIFLKFQYILCILKHSHPQSLISESMSVEISLMNKENNKGPKTVSCGTPDKTGAQLAVVCSTEKNLSISVSSHLCHSQTVWCQMLSQNLK